MTPAEHADYWVKEFSRRLYLATKYSEDWWKYLKLRANAVKEWRKFHTLKAV